MSSPDQTSTAPTTDGPSPVRPSRDGSNRGHRDGGRQHGDHLNGDHLNGAQPNGDARGSAAAAVRERADLGDYLRRRRGLMSPPDREAGRTSRRRVPGLRRQELSEQAGISVEYYTRLEQGRASRPSREVLGALARALELSDPERDHVFRLAGELPPSPTAPDPEIRPGLLRLLQGLNQTMPVSVHDGRLDLVTQNAAATELLPVTPLTGPFARNIVYHAFSDDAVPEIIGPDGADGLARFATAELRSALSRYPGDAYLLSLLAELTAASASFREHWARNEVGTWRSSRKRIKHPVHGWLAFDTEVLHDPERDHWVVLYTPV